MNSNRPRPNDPCTCRSGKKYRQCCWLSRFEKPTAPENEPTTERCVCGSGKPYRKCCFPRSLLDLNRPNGGIEPHLERAAFRRAVSRLNSLPRQSALTIDRVAVGRTRLECAALPPCGIGESTTGTLAPPTPLQIEAKYEAIRDTNSEGITEVVVAYSYPEMFGFAEARILFDADTVFVLADDEVAVCALSVLPGMRIRLADGTIGTITSAPETCTELPVPPLPLGNGLWSSRIVGHVKRTTHELVSFRWAGQEVRVTPGHLVWSEDRRWWIRAHELVPGELVRVSENHTAPVEGYVRLQTGLIEVYGVEVEYFHNYFVGTGPDAMLVHNGECVTKPVERDPDGMARIRGRQLEPYELQDKHGGDFEAHNAMAESVMTQLGVPKELRGVRESGPHARMVTGEPFTFEMAQGGSNVKPGRQPRLESRGMLKVEKRGINVDGLVLEKDALPFESWQKAEVRQRMEAVVAHEFAEYQSPSPNASWRHADALMRSYRNPHISPQARAIIADQIRAAILGQDAQIATHLAPRIQQALIVSTGLG